VAPPLALAATAIARRRLAPSVIAALAGLLGLLLVVLIGVFGAVFGLQPLYSGSHEPSDRARGQIPHGYLRLYVESGGRYGIDPWVLAGIGWVETRHGRLRAAGVRESVNAHGCCAGPMQFSVVGSPSTWDRFGVDGDRDGRKSPHDPADAIPAAARYLRAAGAPEDYRAALYAYNHADWYVNEVLAKAAEYRGRPTDGALPAGSASVRELLENPRILLTPLQRADLQSGTIDERLLGTLAAIGRRHTVMITALKSDHYPGTNHEAGRAMDIGMVDGEICRGARTGPCADLVRELAAMEGPLRATELIYCWEPDSRDDPRGFARSDHCDHIHWGMDG
jgi:hypothetical protein